MGMFLLTRSIGVVRWVNRWARIIQGRGRPYLIIGHGGLELAVTHDLEVVEEGHDLVQILLGVWVELEVSLSVGHNLREHEAW